MMDRIAEESMMREAVDRQNRRLAQVAAHTKNLVVITDATGCIEWVNQAFEDRTGWTIEEVIGKRPGAILQGSDTDAETVQKSVIISKKVKAYSGNPQL